MPVMMMVWTLNGAGAGSGGEASVFPRAAEQWLSAPNS
jgi:hypothetical protein